MKITTKTTKQELVNFLGANAKKVKAKDEKLFHSMAYASRMMKDDEKKVTRKDLMDLAKDVMRLLGDSVSEPSAEPQKVVAENSVKKKVVKKNTSSETPKTETPKEEPKKEVKKEPKKEPKKDIPNKVVEKAITLAEVFPKTLEIGEDDDKKMFKLATDIKNMEDLYKAIGADEEIVFAYYWTKRHLKQFPYFNDWLGHPKSFENDLDLATTLFVSDELKVSYQVSMYTEAIYTILPEDIEEIDGIRYSCGTEYQIYRAVE